MTLLWYNKDKEEISYAQVRLFSRKKEDNKFQQVFYVKYKPEDFIYLLDGENSLYNNIIFNEQVCDFQWKGTATVYSL